MAIKIPRLGKTRHGVFYVRVYFFAQNGQRKLKQHSLFTKNPEEARALALKFNLQIEERRMNNDGTKNLFEKRWTAEERDTLFNKFELDLSKGVMKSDGTAEDRAAMMEAIKLYKEIHGKEPPIQEATNQAPPPQGFTPPRVLRRGKLFSEATELYLLEKQTDNAATTIVEKRRTYKDFLATYSDLDINLINKPEIVAFKTADLRRELGANRINKRLGQLNDFFRWAIDNEHYTASGTSPCDKLFISDKSKLAKQTEKKEPFSNDDLKKLFGVVVVVEKQGEKLSEKQISYAERMFAPDHYWIPLVCLFSGARREEIGDLLTENVQTIDDVQCFQIEKGKTAAARRVVPIHSELIKLGFLEYAAARRAAGDIQLFPHRAKGAGGRSKEAGRMFAKREREDCKITTSRKTIHSLRHSVITRLAQVKAQSEHSYQITGHADENSKTVHSQVYTHGMGLLALAETLELLKYPMEFERVPDPTFSAYFNTAGGRGEDEKKAARAAKQAEHLAAKAAREERNRDKRKK